MTFIRCFVNEVEVDAYGVAVPYAFNDDWATCMTNMQVIRSGETLVVNVFLDRDRSTLSSGTLVRLKLHSAGGMNFPRVVELT